MRIWKQQLLLVLPTEQQPFEEVFQAAKCLRAKGMHVLLPGTGCNSRMARQPHEAAFGVVVH